MGKCDTSHRKLLLILLCLKRTSSPNENGNRMHWRNSSLEKDGVMRFWCFKSIADNVKTVHLQVIVQIVTACLVNNPIARIAHAEVFLVMQYSDAVTSWMFTSQTLYNLDSAICSTIIHDQKNSILP